MQTRILSLTKGKRPRAGRVLRTDAVWWRPVQSEGRGRASSIPASDSGWLHPSVGFPIPQACSPEWQWEEWRRAALRGVWVILVLRLAADVRENTVPLPQPLSWFITCIVALSLLSSSPSHWLMKITEDVSFSITSVFYSSALTNLHFIKSEAQLKFSSGKYGTMWWIHFFGCAGSLPVCAWLFSLPLPFTGDRNQGALSNTPPPTPF